MLNCVGIGTVSLLEHLHYVAEYINTLLHKSTDWTMYLFHQGWDVVLGRTSFLCHPFFVGHL